jgi:hypothetical protein
MATVTSKWQSGELQMPIPGGPETITVLTSLAVTAAQTDDDDIYEMCPLPAGCALVDAVFAATDLDTGTPAHVMSFGVVNADGDDLTTALMAGVDVGKAGTATRLTPTLTTLGTKASDDAPIKLGYKVTTASATGAAGTVYLQVSYRATNYGA